MTTLTAWMTFFQVDVRDDETPIFTPSTNIAGSRQSLPLTIKSIPYTMRKTEFTVCKNDIKKADTSLKATTGDILSFNYVLITESPPPDESPSVYTNQRMFRITDIEQISYNDTIRFSVILDPMATATYCARAGLYNKFKIKGVWSRVPDISGIDAFEKIALRPDVMTVSSVLKALPKDDPGDFQYSIGGSPIVYVQVSGTHDDGGTKKFITCGYFCFVKKHTSDPPIKVSTLDTRQYPILEDIINEPENYTPFSGNDILDMSVSFKAPFTTSMTYDADAHVVYVNSQAGIGAESLTSPYAYLKVPPEVYYSETLTVSLTVSDAHHQKMCGTLQIRDGYGSPIGNIDTRHFGTNDSITIKYECIGDYGGITSYLYLPDGSKITMPEGHLPYNTSAYAQYVAENQQYDREMMQIAKDKATAELIAGTAGSVANGLFTGIFSGGLGALTAITGIVGNVAGYVIDQDTANREQSAKEKQVQATADSAYGTSYGMSYIKANTADKDIRRSIVIIMPKSSTATEMNEFVKDNGYPVTNHYGTFDVFSASFPSSCGMRIDRSPTFTLESNYTPNSFVELNKSLLGRWCSDQLKYGIKCKVGNTL